MVDYIKRLFGCVPEDEKPYLGLCSVSDEIESGRVTTYATPEFIQNFNRHAQPRQRTLVDELKEDPESLSKKVIVVHQDIVVDGNHKLMAMYLAGLKRVYFIEV